ncbi:MAG TPA: beta-ketoacyl-[acyl-carrier-protein] synthase family protein [Gemmataceae bacterium]|nr:beta-ketoacyl-[acyl-carrier-protein] synthase family protein [Gemmataceae bacterium]
MRKRVVITGMGALTPLGHRVEELFQALLKGESGVGPITHFDARTFPTTFAAEVKGFSLSRHVPRGERWANAGPNTRFALAAGKQALEDSGLLSPAQGDRTCFGVYLGTGEGEPDFQNHVRSVARSYQKETSSLDARRFAACALNDYHPGCEYEQELHTTPGHVARYFQLEGPNYNCLTACAASSQAIGEAAERIRDGDADMMLAGGSHSIIHPLGVTGFNLLTALSTRNEHPKRASRPFDLRRDGFVMGEGAGMVVLEDMEHALRRGARIYAELTGYGSTADALRVTDSHPEGRGAIACMRQALADADLRPEDIGYINAHGTSTQLNDLVETIAIKNVFGEYAYRVPISSSKSMLGHLVAAAGAVELIICMEAIRKGILPPTINYETPDPRCDLDYIPNMAREKTVDHVLSNSFGFGGQNVSLIVSRFHV